MLRDDLDLLPAYVPGVRAEGALKLSSNEVTQPPIPAVAEAMANAVAGANRYPDMFSVALRQKLAATVGLTLENVAIGIGSSALCQQLVQITCRPGDKVVFPWRSFEGYPIFAAVVGATSVPVPLDAEFRNDLDALAAAAQDAKLVFLCNPNNPTGTTHSHEAIAEFLKKVPGDVVVALDEAYIEYVRDAAAIDALALLAKHPNLVVLRTFSKAYGLAGARVGYAFAAPAIIEAINKVQIPFGINVAAQAGAVAALEHSEEILSRTSDVAVQRTRVARALGAVPSQANFVWVPDLADIQATGAALAERGILVRCFPEGMRITVTTAEEMDQLIDAWRDINPARTSA
ncbi:histidinol-phosphate transaminase [Corynebacterium sp. 13CS0277]|uniref:histidinol-phosphate transaminase n=1 Tax=Corynebacterium sp. 13CS0277 TaxID=2071994 RepID=UPI000D034C77|nr:histidinol-phosphate transaminase [Corynebacterium sp. 13CS0277]PRQ10436.1 histidinol-phosphate transaminase [Corynebacterium sp. 13CS0277]